MVEGLFENMKIAGAYLSNSVEICCLCLKVSIDMTENQYQTLRAYLSSWVDDGNLQSDLSWEEATLSATAHLLRTSLSKKQGQ